MVNFFQKFIPGFADTALPLNALRRKDAKFVWGPEQEQAFQALKEAIASPPVLHMADFERQFILRTDASTCSLGAVLLQEVDGVRQPVAYASRTLNLQERKS